MFDPLRTLREHNKYAVINSGHFVAPQSLVRETLAWLNKYFGPVTLR